MLIARRRHFITYTSFRLVFRRRQVISWGWGIPPKSMFVTSTFAAWRCQQKCDRYLKTCATHVALNGIINVVGVPSWIPNRASFTKMVEIRVLLTVVVSLLLRDCTLAFAPTCGGRGVLSYSQPSLSQRYPLPSAVVRRTPLRSRTSLLAKANDRVVTMNQNSWKHSPEDEETDHGESTRLLPIGPPPAIMETPDDSAMTEVSNVWTQRIQPAFIAILDVNQDGKLDGKDAMALLTVVLVVFSLVLVEPAFAKGGGSGHGGGGHGGGHSSSHSTSTCSSSSRSASGSGGSPRSSGGVGHSSYRLSSPSSPSNNIKTGRSSSRSSVGGGGHSSSYSSSSSSSTNSGVSVHTSSGVDTHGDSHASPSSHSSSSRGSTGGPHRNSAGVRHSSSSSYSYATPSSPTTPDFVQQEEYDRPHYPAFRRPFPNNRYSRPRDPDACSNLPAEGEELDILLGDPDLGIYVPGRVVHVQEEDCRFRAVYANPLYGGPTTKTFSVSKNWVDWLLLEVLAGVGLAAALPSIARATLETRESITESWLATISKVTFATEKAWHDVTTRAKEGAEVAGQPFPSGRYVGSTMESDGIAQTVQVNLTFTAGGMIRGSGRDSEDGPYTLEGTWDGDQLKWTEYYPNKNSQYLTVSVTGFRRSSNEISCQFRSSEGIVGRFQIQQQVD